VESRINLVEALLLFFGFLLAAFLGSRFYRYLGIWAMLPAILIGLHSSFSGPFEQSSASPQKGD